MIYIVSDISCVSRICKVIVHSHKHADWNTWNWIVWNNGRSCSAIFCNVSLVWTIIKLSKTCSLNVLAIVNQLFKRSTAWWSVSFNSWSWRIVPLGCIAKKGRNWIANYTECRTELPQQGVKCWIFYFVGIKFLCSWLKLSPLSRDVL